MQYLVIDFGGTFAKYSVMDEACEVYLRQEKPAPLASREEFLSFIENLYEDLSQSFSLSGIAISMPGVIDGDTGYIKTAGAYMPMAGMNLKDALKDRVPVPISVENDGKCGALAEVWKGNLSDVQDGICLILGTGVAGGVIVNRKVFRGKSLAAGEFSYFLLGDGGEMRDMAVCRCGVAALLYHAMLEKGIDVTKSAHHWLLSPFLGENSFLSEANDDPAFAEGIDGHQFFDLLNQGDPAIAKVYDRFLTDLATMIFNIQLTTAPQRVVIGGGIIRQPRLIGDIRGKYLELEEKASSIFSLPCEIEVCRFGNEANQYGALYNFLRQVEL